MHVIKKMINININILNIFWYVYLYKSNIVLENITYLLF